MITLSSYEFSLAMVMMRWYHVHIEVQVIPEKVHTSVQHVGVVINQLHS